jgi:iron complex outermembrane receptor protein
MSPELSISANYERPIALSGGGTITPSVGMKYQSDQWFGANNYPVQKQEAYAYVDAGLMFEPESGNWSVQAYVKNLTNKTVFADATEFYTFNNYTFTYQPPRTFGVRFTAKFR